MIKNFCNFNYEKQLKNNTRETTSSDSKINRELEFLYFFVEDEKTILCAQNKYSQEYLKHLTDLGLTIPQIDYNYESDYNFWWGSLKDFDLERKINSKITSSKIAIKNKWAHPLSKIIRDKSEVEDYFNENRKLNKIFIRAPFSVSGRECYLLDKVSSIPNRLDFSEGVIIEPYLERVNDYGVLIEANGEIKIWKNFVSLSGSYIGGQLEKADHFDSNIFYKIYNAYLEIGLVKRLQIDAFTYLEDEEIKNYYLSEVNYRKTMGLFLCSLQKFYEYPILIMAEKNNSIQNYSIEKLKSLLPEGVLLLSPENTKKISVLIDGSDQLKAIEVFKKLNDRLFNKNISLKL